MTQQAHTDQVPTLQSLKKADRRAYMKEYHKEYRKKIVRQDVRLSVEEFSRVKKFAASQGCKVGTLLKECLITHMDGTVPVSPVEERFFRQFIEQTRRIGTNINAIARKVNATSSLSQDEFALLVSSISEMEDFFEMYMRSHLEGRVKLALEHFEGEKIRQAIHSITQPRS